MNKLYKFCHINKTTCFSKRNCVLPFEGLWHCPEIDCHEYACHKDKSICTQSHCILFCTLDPVVLTWLYLFECLSYTYIGRVKLQCCFNIVSFMILSRDRCSEQTVKNIRHSNTHILYVCNALKLSTSNGCHYH